MFDLTHVIGNETLPVQEDLTYEEKPVKVFARDIMRMRIKVILLLKVSSCNHRDEEVTWKRE